MLVIYRTLFGASLGRLPWHTDGGGSLRDRSLSDDMNRHEQPRLHVHFLASLQSPLLKGEWDGSSELLMLQLDEMGEMPKVHINHCLSPDFTSPDKGSSRAPHFELQWLIIKIGCHSSIVKKIFCILSCLYITSGYRLSHVCFSHWSVFDIYHMCMQ